MAGITRRGVAIVLTYILCIALPDHTCQGSLMQPEDHLDVFDPLCSFSDYHPLCIA